jgi:hypothetical protein
MGHPFRAPQEAARRRDSDLAGPTLGKINTGVAVIEAPDEATARQIMEDDPTIAGGFAIGELRGFRVSLLRGRD